MNVLSRYLDRIASIVRHSEAIDDTVTYRQLTPDLATMEGVLVFYDGSRLDFTEVIQLTKQTIHKQRYRYQYVKDDQTVFRYDNSPHHLHLSTFPHHKHDASSRILESDEVALEDVLAEISTILAR